jgi:hypothetical protein
VTAQLYGVTPAPGDEQVVSLWLQARTDAALLNRRAFRAAIHRKLKRFLALLFKAAAVAEQERRLVTGLRLSILRAAPEVG